VVGGEVKYMYMMPIAQKKPGCWIDLGLTVFPSSVVVYFNYVSMPNCPFAKTQKLVFDFLLSNKSIIQEVPITSIKLNYTKYMENLTLPVTKE